MKAQFYFLLAFCCFTLNGFPSAEPEEAVKLFNNYISLYPQEKIYVHTDKPDYFPGETIFFRSYLVDATSHLPGSPSRYIYVELINDTDSIKERIKIKPHNQLFYGTLSLPETCKEGNYRLRAYTTYMRNIPEDFFFTKNIRIGNPPAVTGKNEKSTTFEVNFYPEGGQLIAGYESKVGFKALLPNGLSCPVQGEITDESGNQVATFSTLDSGMGSFSFTPAAGKKYYASCESENEVKKRVALPEVYQTGYALKVTPTRDKIWISIPGVSPATGEPEKLYLFSHTRGMLQYAGEWDLSNERVVLDKNRLPDGILHILLTDSRFRVLSERLVFVEKKEENTYTLDTDKENYSVREVVKVRFSAGTPGSCSVSVTDDAVVQVDTTENIRSSLLLTSDIKGNIENPASYLGKDDNLTLLRQDLLMLTHGWRRYEVADIFAGKTPGLIFPIENGLAITGKVTGGLLLNKSAKNSPVVAIASEVNYSEMTETGENGRFVFEIPEFPDKTPYIIQAFPRKETGRVKLEVDPETFPTVNTPAVFPTFLPLAAATDEYIHRVKNKYDYYNGDRLVNLDGVEVNAQKKEPKMSQYYSSPDFSMNEEQIRNSGAGRFINLLQQYPGLYVSGNEQVSIRGSSVHPLLVVNDIVVDSSFLSMIDISDIEQLDIVKPGTNAYLMGEEAAGGIISVYTKSGGIKYVRDQINIRSVTPLASQQPVEFYSPVYDTEEKKNNPVPDLRNTIFWEPGLVLDGQGKADFEFYASDSMTGYTVVIEGLSDAGEPIYYRHRIQPVAD